MAWFLYGLQAYRKAMLSTKNYIRVQFSMFH